MRDGIEGELAQAADEAAAVAGDEEVRVVDRAELDRSRERHDDAWLQIEAVELVELGEGVADRVVRAGAASLEDAVEDRIVEALAEVHAPAGDLVSIPRGERVVREDPRAVVRALPDGH